MAEPERAVLGGLGDQARVDRGDLGQRGDPLGAAAELVADQELLHTRGRQGHLAFVEVLEQTAGAEGGPGDRFGEHDLDRWVGVALGMAGERRPLGMRAASP